jgi:glycosyltransferase involved in cell wall biosynthesis
VSVVDSGIDAKSLAALLYRADRLEAAVDEAGEAAFRTVLESVGERSYDIVHNHAFDPPAVRYAARLSCPVVHTLHLPADRALAAALNQARRSANPPTVATVSQSAAIGWRKVSQIDLVLRNGVPIDRIPWSRSNAGGLLFAGRFSPEKGASEAIEIARLAGVPIELFGDAYDAQYAREHVENHRTDPGVSIHAGLPREALWRRMSEARAVVCPVQWEEPFGLVAAEAQAAGTPVIAYRRGALPELVLDGKTGFLVPAADVTAAATAVNSVGGISRLACREHAEAHLSLDAMIAAHEALYHRLQIAAGSGRHG